MGGKLRVFFLGNAFLDMSPEAQVVIKPKSSKTEEKTWFWKGKGICKLYI